MSVSGEWTLHFDWGCSGTYGQVPMTFNNDGTFNLAPYTGVWTENEGKIIWRFDTALNTVYGGDVVDAAMVGISSTFTGLTGCWYALQGSSTTMAFAERAAETDVAGNKTNQP